MTLFKRIGLAALLMTGVALPITKANAAQSYISFLGQAESGNNYHAGSSTSSAMGAYQLTSGALQATGYQNSNGQWTGKDGVYSASDYLNNPTAQQNSATAYSQIAYQSQISQGNGALIGQTVNGIQVNEAVLTDCAYVLGPSGCNQWLQNGTFSQQALNSNGSNFPQAFLNREAAASQSDPSAITNGANTAVANNANGYTPSNNSGGPALYCNPQISQMMQQNGTQTVQQWVLLASAPGTGYTTMGGGSVLQAAGIANGGGAGPVASALGVNDSDYYMVSCVDRLMNSGLNIFGNFNLSDILARLEQAACNQLYSMFAQVTQPLNQSLGQYTGANIPGIGGFFPGINLGSIGGGINSGITPGNPNGNGPSVNFIGSGPGGANMTSSIGVQTGDTNWYRSSNNFNQPGVSNFGQNSLSGVGQSYGPLFGRQQYP